MRKQLLLLWPNYGDELLNSECAINCYYFDQINGDELSHSECAINCYYFDQIMVMNCHTQNVQTIVITLSKLAVTNCHTQNAQTIVITLTKLWWWTVTLRMCKQLLLLWPNYGDELSHSECANNCYYFDQINGDELSHSECTTNCYYFYQIMELNCHTRNAQTIFIISTKLWSWTVTLGMRNQFLLLLLIHGGELSHPECATNCYYFDQINGDELSHSECTTNCYYFDQIMVTNCHTQNV